MQYRQLGRTALQVSALGFGALEIGRNWPYWRKERDDFSRPDEHAAQRVIDMAIDNGINFFDTAPAYHFSEEILGKFLGEKRKSVILATKCGEWFDGERSVYDYSAAETMKFIESSLHLLRTDYIDLLQIHSASADVIRRGETLGAVMKAKQEGKIRFIGLSTEDEEAALLSIANGGYDALQVSLNILKRKFAAKVFPEADKANTGIIIKDGMAMGKLTNKFHDIESMEEHAAVEKLQQTARVFNIDISELALRFVLTHSFVDTVIVGTKNLTHLAENLQSESRGNLSPELLQAIEKILISDVHPNE